MTTKKKPAVAIGRDGKPLSRKPQNELSFDERVKKYRIRIGIAERREGTFPIFPLPALTAAAVPETDS
jgi:hypothetical protein